MQSEIANSPKTSPLVSLSREGRDEMNLVEFPIALLTDRIPKDQNEAVFQDEIFDERSGRTLTRKLTITGGSFGLTTPVDDEIILALIQLTRQKNDFTKRKVEFSRHELIQILGWPAGGVKYERIELSLDRWTSVYLKYENAWRDNKTKTWTSPEGFHIIDNYKLNDSRTTGDQLELLPSYIIWNEVIFESFQAGYLKPLDYDLCSSLRNSTAKRMYRFLDKRFHHKSDWTFDLKELSHEHIGMGRHYEGPAHLKRNLQPAIVELESVGFLEPLPDAERFTKHGKEWKVRLTQKLPAATVLQLPDSDKSPEPSPLFVALTARGVTAATAAELTQAHSEESIYQKIDVLDWLVEKRDKRAEKSPAGYLVKSIKTDYAVPKGYVAKADRDRAADSARQRQQAEEAKRRMEREQAAKEQAIMVKVAAYRRAVTADQLAQLEADAIAQADDDSRRSLNDPAMKAFRKTLIHRMTDEHIARLIEAEPEPV
jgi:Replication initiator protein A